MSVYVSRLDILFLLLYIAIKMNKTKAYFMEETWSF